MQRPSDFEPLIAEDACGGSVTVVGEPTFVSLPGSCDGESVEKRYTTLIDQCGNQTTVQQTVVIEDNDAPFWLNEPDEQIVTDNLDGEVFDVPVADDICSDFQVNMTSTYQDGLCPLSVVLTRTFTATDQCGNTSAPFVQTITESTDLTAELDFTAVNCHDGSDGTASVSYEGGVAPYTVDWGGYDPENLAAGEYSVEVNDANLCSVEMDFIITEPAPFTMTLAATTPECMDPNSGALVADVNGGSGEITIDWGGVDPNSLSAGTYEVVATDELGCQAMATGVVPSADIPDPLELTGDANVVQGDSAAYYYEYTLGSTYDWTFSGATEEEVLTIFAISLLWDSLGTHQVCVTETNQEGCAGAPVCMEVFVQDDVWNVAESSLLPFSGFPNPANDRISLQFDETMLGSSIELVNTAGAVVLKEVIQRTALVLDVAHLPAGSYVIRSEHSIGIPFQIIH